MIKLRDILIEGNGHTHTAGIILVSDVGIVLCKEDNYWGIPKGGIDLGETPLEAAIRETVEETSILVSAMDSHINTPIIEVAKKKNSKGGDFYIFTTNLKLPIIPIKSHEHEEVRYFDTLPEDIDQRLEGLI
jgi:8-oxo-dGTP pyrophosphatase MutT (NUDIX family)